jgi:hypothetical protein
MTTNRTPIAKDHKARVTQAAMEAYRRWRELPACEHRVEQHWIVHYELNLKPWVWWPRDARIVAMLDEALLAAEE